MLALLMVVVFGIVWARRRWTRRREVTKGALAAHAEAESMLREREIIEDLEARFQE